MNEPANRLSEMEAPRSSWTVRSTLACHLWIVLAVGLWLSVPSFQSKFEDFGVRLGVVTHNVLHPNTPFLLLFIGFEFLAAIALAQKQQTRRMITFISLTATSLCAAVILYGLFGPLLELMRSLS